MDPLYDCFCDPTQQFFREARWFCYDIATEQIAKAKMADPTNWYENAHTVRGVLLLLFTWNSAAPITKKLDEASIAKALKESKDDLQSLANYTIISADDKAWSHVGAAFSAFKTPCGQTGAAKALSLLNPELFVMWDTAIRNRLNRHLIPGIETGQTAEQYITFLQGIQRIIKKHGIQGKLPPGSILAKQLDEYHYVQIVMKMNPA